MNCMIKAGSDLEILNVPFDVRCSFQHVRYNKQPFHRADAAASLCPKTVPTSRERSPISRGAYASNL